MVVSQLVENKINDIESIKVFTIKDLGFPAEWWENVRVKLGRMVKAGQLEKVGRGKFFKPKSSVFGNIGPKQSEVVKDLMYDNGILSGYITGYGIWNQMGLTSQIPNIIVIGTSRRRDSLKRGHYKVRFIMQPNKITQDNIHLLQILDSLKMLKLIPDTTISKSIAILRNHVADLKEKQLEVLVRLAVKYPPRVRALLGALLESLKNFTYIENLKKTLNPMTRYSIGVSGDTGLNLINWNLE